MRTPAELHWLAGLIEGEGCFYKLKALGCGHAAAGITLQMTDRDVVERAAAMFGASVREVRDPRPNNRPTYRLDVRGRRAAAWMMTLYCLMGQRRRGKIRELLTLWRMLPQRERRADGTFHWVYR